VRAYDKDGKLLAFYPATIGSEEKPAPSGDFKMKRVEWNPNFRYDPQFHWKDVKSSKKLTIRPGPNNPVGLVWIDLPRASASDLSSRPSLRTRGGISLRVRAIG
jgi:lipoprotein-anchoring transpeptidase ErfK/SrfK